MSNSGENRLLSSVSDESTQGKERDTVKATIIDEDRSLVTREVEDPNLEMNSVRVRVVRCGICGSDLHARQNLRYPAGAVLGHEIVGEVIELGPGVESWKPGDRVALYHAVACGRCEMCADGFQHMCLDALSTSLGLGKVQGGYAEHIAVPAAILQPIPEGLSFDHAALAEPLSISLHGVNKAQVVPGDPVCVLGAGPIGAMAACALKSRGVDDVVIVEPNERRREKLVALGFAAVGVDGCQDSVPAALGGHSPKAVLECSGHVSSAALGVQLAAYRGRVVLQGVPREPVSISQFDVVQKEIEVVGAASSSMEEFTEAIDILAAGSIPADALISRIVPLEQAQETFDELSSTRNIHMKVLLAPTS